MTTHLITSHGADFFGQDRHPLKAIGSLAGYAEGVLPAAERAQLVKLLQSAGAGEHLDVPAADAGVLGEQLHRIARHKFVKSKAAALAAALLADAADRAAKDGEAWTWRTEAA
ncbi:hypothetical protein ACODT3_41200 [Streptomyces sp. 4.24]|uniref:DUF7739 domain-containing protein n=1 Tax=Streptomyces tritrimontium TaxID=3406573 RepID=UPI003BB76E0B